MVTLFSIFLFSSIPSVLWNYRFIISLFKQNCHEIRVENVFG